MTFKEVLRALDWPLIITAVLLVGISLAMLFSTTYQTGNILAGRFIRQIVAASIGCALLLAIARLPYTWWRRYAIVMWGVGMAGLIVVALLAQVIRGTASRLSLWGIQIQPSEFMKIGVVIILAFIFARARMLSWSTFSLSVLAVGLPVALLLLEPDAGMAALLLATWGIVLVFIGLPWRTLLLIALTGIVASVAVWNWVLIDYQKNRLLTFIDPTHDPQGAGYNVTQSIVALGSGTWLGRGLGHGPQSRLQFLPEQHTDFIFASIGEELGFVGTTVVITLYALMLWRILRIAGSTSDWFGRVVAVGVFSVLLLSFVISAGMNMGLLPVTGLPLPLVSYGGSNVVATFILLGIVESIYVHSKWTQAPPTDISYLT